MSSLDKEPLSIGLLFREKRQLKSPESDLRYSSCWGPTLAYLLIVARLSLIWFEWHWFVGVRCVDSLFLFFCISLYSNWPMSCDIVSASLSLFYHNAFLSLNRVHITLFCFITLRSSFCSHHLFLLIFLFLTLCHLIPLHVILISDSLDLSHSLFVCHMLTLSRIHPVRLHFHHLLRLLPYSRFHWFFLVPQLCQASF